MAPKVLMVAEKPSIALSVASALSGGRMSTRRGSTDVHEFDGMFRGLHAHFKVTSVIGHVFSVDFPPTYQNWEVTDPMDLFQAPILKSESNPKAHIRRHLSQEAKGCGYLVLWLDCDREGENICYEVIDCTGIHENDAGRRIYRARFSSVTEKDILKAMDNLVAPNKDEALAVDARQEIDLKVGVAFTRFQTRYFQGKYGNLDSRVISYGPCQTPTLGFCVQRYMQITTFKPEKYWSLNPCIIKDGYELRLEWDRNKVFDYDVAVMFQKLVSDNHTLKVTDISTKEECKNRPCGLNTVNMLKVASSALGFGPHMAMQLAERLYTQGFISYPRTESTAYPSSFDFRAALGVQLYNPIWGNDVRALLADGFHKPRCGLDAGDHPPITPMRSATEDMLGNDAWRLYQYICQHFIGTVSPDCHYTRTKVEFAAGGELFHSVGQRVTAKGFTSIMPWMAVGEKNLPQFTKGEKIDILKVDLYEGSTSPPDYLSESELISLMEKNGIGTDASIPVHINNICERNYVQVNSGRRLVPMALGTTLIRGYQCIDPDLCLPDIRGFIEQQIALIAKGKADHIHVVQHVLQQFKQKYTYFVRKIENMDALFEAQFSPLADSGRLLSKCGKCTRYMKYISAQPQRLYCVTCEEVYYLPQNGTIKLYKELACPLDGFELVLFSMAGPDGKTFPLCPYCYNSPPFEGIDKLFGALKLGSSGKIGKGAGMPCFLCPHPTCRHSLISQGVCACPECSGTLVLDPVSAPRWRLYCNMCNCLVSLPQGAHRISTTGKKCPECDSTIIEVDFNKRTTPLSDGATLHVGCILCDELLHSLVEMKHGKSFFRRGRGRGRGRGRASSRGRGRGRSKYEDPKMSFRDF
ncbi:DNA topoisomerase 3-beta isoform X1 [Phoenix dactylifera]|uniref:DNA topoisomerase n=3 Tax=Phoenix dactylifera TaxID=42345 RepID=A0A8B7C6T9_PHODC|nr:DNA topoisomerase 3-beta isoform X1 [Phoenix dactylifera]XP_008792954.1 DNA topoisomerase 3-beta isoform X1 [Phoenix dactylifera]